MHPSKARPSLAALVVAALVGALIPPFVSFEPARAQAPDTTMVLPSEEVRSLRTKYSKTFYEGNGTYVAQISTRPQHFRAPDGSWEEIDTTLVPCTDTSCAWRNNKGAFSVEFAALASDSLVTVEDGPSRVSFGPANPNTTGPVLVDGSHVTYKNIYPGVDLRYEVTTTGVKELIILNEAPSAPLDFDFPMTLTDLSVSQKPSGEIELARPDGALEFTIPALWMEDSSADPDTGEGAQTESVVSTLSSNQNAVSLRVTPDLEWLQDPSRVYPVAIDPTISNEADRDTWVRAGTGSNGTQDVLKVGTDAAGGNVARTLAHFPLNLPATAAVRNATLKMHNTDSHGTACSGSTVNVHRITSSWTEGVDWNGQPSHDSGTVLVGRNWHRQPNNGTCPTSDIVDFGDPEPNLPTNCTDNEYRTPISQVVQDWHAAPTTNHGLMLKVANESVADTWKFYSSREPSNWPSLFVSYTNPPNVPTDLYPPNPTTSSNTSPTLQARYSDQDAAVDGADAGCVEFELWPSGSQQLAERRYGTFVGSGELSVCSSCFALQQGTTYEWRARGYDEWIKSAWSATFVNTVPPPPPPPAPSITGPSPTSPSNNLNPSWSFSGQAGGSFRCQLQYEGSVKESWSTCSSPKSYYLGNAGYSDGSYSIQVKQVDDFSAEGPVATGNPYRLDRAAPPTPNITSSPSSPSNNTSPSWGFTSGGGDSATFSCRITRSDGTEYHPPEACSPSSKSFSVTENGTFHFEVKARDAAGNDSAFVRSGAYVLDIQIPSAPTITQSPTSPTTNANPSWSFTGESGATFQCQFGTQTTPLSSGWSTCSSPYTASLAGQNGGTYNFYVRQIDQATNVSGAATSAYIYDVAQPAAPVVTATPHSQETGWYKSRTPTFNWSVASPPASGISGYSDVLDRSPTTVPPDTITSTSTSKTYDSPLDEGRWYFHVKARSGSGVWGSVGHRTIQIDATVPSQPQPVSKSHVPGVAFQSKTIEVTWPPSSDLKPGVTDVSGVDRYVWAFRREGTGGGQGAEADAACASTDGCGSSLAADPSATWTLPTGTSEGRYWFHIKAVDKADNKSSDKVYGPLIVSPNGAAVPLAPTLTDLLAPQSDTNGLEQFYPYRSMSLGTAQGFVNLHSGNLVVQQTDSVIPLVGLNTVIRHTYNSQRDTSAYHDTGVGKGWVLSLSDADTGLDAASAASGIDVNTPLLSTTADIAGATGRVLELTDADGTAHRFVKEGVTGSRWQSPPGVDLRVQDTVDGTGQPTQYDLVRSDGVRYIVKQVSFAGLPVEWRVVAVRDRNGNELTLAYTAPLITTSRGRLFTTRLASVTHSRFPTDPVATFAYANGDLTKIETYPNHARREITYSIKAETGRLESVVDNSHTTPANGKRTTTYGYETKDPDNNPVTPGVDVLASVVDARGNTTYFTHERANGAYRVKTVTDRRGKVWSYGYQTQSPSGDTTTTVTSPLGRATTYRSSTRASTGGLTSPIAGGNILEIRDAGNNVGTVTNTYEWFENRLVSKTNGVGVTTTMEYNDLGLLESITAPPPNNPSDDHLHADAPKQPVVTTFDYAYSERYAGCSDQPAGSPIQRQESYCYAIADLAKETVAGERVTDFEYNTSGDLRFIYERGRNGEADRKTEMTYYSSGLLKSVDGPRSLSDVTVFGDQSADAYGGYHRSGLPLKIVDADQKAKLFEYSAYGAVTKITDRAGRVQTMDYDERDNLRTSTHLWESTESTADDRVSSFTYDENDNLKTATSPRGSATAIPANDFMTTYVYNENDQRFEVKRPGLVDPNAARVTTVGYDDDGLRTTVDGPLVGTSDRTTFVYWPNNSMRFVTAPAATGDPAVTRYFYDLAGRVSRIQFPKVAATGSPPEKNVSYTPQGAPAVTRGTSASGQIDRVTKASYDAQGRLIELLGPRKLTDAQGTYDQAQQQSYDSFGQLTSLRTRVDGTKWLEYGYTYDPAGNVTAVTQPAGDSAAESLTAQYTYDALNRLDKQTVDPVNPGHTTEYTYLPEGQQEKRVDLVDGQARRTVTNTYNPDYTVRSMMATGGGETLSQCNFLPNDPDPTSGYDRDGNLLVTRTLSGDGGCSSGTSLARDDYAYNHAGLLSEATQMIDPEGAPAPVSRTQTFEYRVDGAPLTHTYAGRKTSYDHTPAGWMKSATDWRSDAAASTFTYSSAGSPELIELGGSAAKGVLNYHPDGSLRSLVWTNSAGAEVRSHRSLTYDEGGLWKSETVSILPAAGDTKVDTGGSATFDYDLAGRLTSWKSPFRLDPKLLGTDNPLTEYTLDDGGNITLEQTKVGGELRREIRASYNHGRLESRTLKTFGVGTGAEDTVTDQTFKYSGLGEEYERHATTRVVGDPLNQTANLDTTTTFDPRGFTSTFDETETAGDGTTKSKNLDYVYDANGRVISRTKGNGETHLYFYFAGSRRLMEETTETGTSRIRYFVGTSGEPLAEQRVGGTTGDAWVWLLRDAKGSVGTELKNDGTVIGQKAYDPYGAPESGGSSKTAGERHSTLGFQAAHTDDVSGRILLGERQYDPTTERFTTPDIYVDSTRDLSLGVDPLTANRYVFAASNPVAFYDDGHGPCDSADHCSGAGGGTDSAEPGSHGGDPQAASSEGTSPCTPAGRVMTHCASGPAFAGPPGSDPGPQILQGCADAGIPGVSNACKGIKFVIAVLRAAPTVRDFIRKAAGQSCEMTARLPRTFGLIAPGYTTFGGCTSGRMV